MIKLTFKLLALSGLLLGGAAAQADFLFVAEGGGNITKIAPDGTCTNFATGLSYPQGVAFDSSGNLYAANYNNDTITKFTTNGTPTLFASSGLSGAQSLAFDRSDNLYAANFRSDTITKFDHNGTPSIFTNVDVHCTGLAFDSDGNLYAANYSDNTITKFAPDGTPTLFANSGLSGPHGLAFDNSGNLYAANYSGGTITKFTTNGIPSLFASGLNGPIGLAFDSNGNLYAANFHGGTIEKFDSAGNDLGVFASVSSPDFIAFDSFLPGLGIKTQPKSQVGYWGKSGTFSVAVKNGTPPVSYQWLKDSTPILDATNDTLILINLQSTNAGNYTVVISDALTHTVTSAPAYLSVNPAGVAIALYAGVTIDGVVGQTYGVQSTTDLASPGSWAGITNVTLSIPTQVWYDAEPASQSQCYYRVVPGPISIP
jgi:sugar lactone lactonase YvrE